MNMLLLHNPTVLKLQCRLAHPAAAPQRAFFCNKNQRHPTHPSGGAKPYQKDEVATFRVAAIPDVSALDFDVPDIDGDLRSVQIELGATFDAAGVVQTYGNSQQAMDAPESGVALIDRSHWPRILLLGRDRIPLLQKCTTNDFSNLASGQGCDTVLLDADGRVVDLVTALLSDSHVMLLVSPGQGPAVLAWLKQQAAEGELKVQAQDVSARCSMISLVGPESKNVLKELAGGEAIPGLPDAYASHMLLKFQGTPLLLAVGCGLPCPGYTLVADESVSGELFSVFAAKGCILMGQQEWECSRILAGRPAAGAELGPGHTPLEAGLYHAANLSKVIGYSGLQAVADAEAWGHDRELWGVDLQAAASPGAVVTANGMQLGNVTSSTTTPSGRHFALAYVGTGQKMRPPTGLQAGMSVEVDGQPACLAAISFASRQFLKDLLAGSGEKKGLVLGPGAESMAKQAEQERVRQLEEAAAEEAARLKRIQENHDRLEAWRLKQLGGRAQ